MLWNPNQLDPTDVEVNLLSWRYSEKQHGAFNYELTAELLVGTNYSFAEIDQEQQVSLYKMYFHLLLEQMPIEAYGELYENLRELYEYYNELKEIQIPEQRVLATIPAQLGEKYFREPFTISD